MTRPGWDFDYVPLWNGYRQRADERDLVVATRTAVELSTLVTALSEFGPDPGEALIERAPLYWYRVRFEQPADAPRVEAALVSAGVDVRYVTSSVTGNMTLGVPLAFDGAPVATPSAWEVRAPRHHRTPASEGHWFLDREAGIDADRRVCGTGAGTRLAVIDDQASQVSLLELDATVVLGMTEPPDAMAHGAAMVAWSVGTRGDAARKVEPFVGVAPDASPRLYFIPKPAQQLLWLPLAIAKAVSDGADVVICSTYIEGTTSPLFDDALEFASVLGRGGLGTLVVFPTGREISSPQNSLHASLTLGLGEPASDPRALCVAPSGREGGWFLWADRRGKKKPFANRGPNVGVAAPGDDIAYPFVRDDRLGHSESSGAAAVAAGVAALVLGQNPRLTAGELHSALADTAIHTDLHSVGPIADAADLLPSIRDKDGHSAKTGYGRLNARDTCLSVMDPISGALVLMGEADAAARYTEMRRDQPWLRELYSLDVAHWAATIVMRDRRVSHALRCLLRHLRLLSRNTDRQGCQMPGALLRLLVTIANGFAAFDGPGPAAVKLEVLARRNWLVAATRSSLLTDEVERACFILGDAAWGKGLYGDQSNESDSPRALGSVPSSIPLAVSAVPAVPTVPAGPLAWKSNPRSL